jgi:hypothetical protein
MRKREGAHGTANGQAAPGIDAATEELLARVEPPGQIAANGFAISFTPENRREPEPGQLFARVTIREVRHPAIKSGPDDSLDDFK